MTVNITPLDVVSIAYFGDSPYHLIEFDRSGNILQTFDLSVTTTTFVFSSGISGVLFGYNTTGDHLIHKINIDGSDGGAFNSDSSPYLSGGLISMSTDSNHNLLVASQDSTIARYLPDGSLDTTWTLNPVYNSSSPVSGLNTSNLAFSPDGRYVYGRGTNSVGGLTYHITYYKWDLQDSGNGAEWIDFGEHGDPSTQGSIVNHVGTTPFSDIAVDPSSGNIAIPYVACSYTRLL